MLASIVTDLYSQRILNSQFQRNILEMEEREKKEELYLFIDSVLTEKTQLWSILILITHSRHTLRRIEILNNSIEDLMELKLDAIQLFHRSLEYLPYKNDNNSMKLLEKCLKDLQYTVENIKLHVSTVEENGVHVQDFNGVGNIFNESIYLEKWIRVFLLQIKADHITWDERLIGKYMMEMNNFCREIEKIEFYSLDHRIVLDQLTGKHSLTKL